MAQDILSQFYSCLNLPIHEKLLELARIIDHSPPNKDLQAIFPLLINNIFGGSVTSAGWSLRTITSERNRLEFELLHQFLEPHGPMFRFCYKLLLDPQLKYNLDLHTLPLELQLSLERGRCSQFYTDLLNMSSHSRNIMSFALNPFDYYVFSFTLHLLNNNVAKGSCDSVITVYFSLVCDYLMHFLPTDPSVVVQPLIPHFMGKVPLVAPLQTANRSLCTPSLLLKPDLSDLSNQHTASQTEPRNEIWRTETVLQVFIDFWMSVDDCNKNNIDTFNRNLPLMTTTSERVRTVRVMVKHIHSYASKYLTDLAPRSSALRKFARQSMCVRGYHYIKYLVATWPLDASFRLVMELWLSIIQPWRYADNVDPVRHDRFRFNINQEDGNTRLLDPSYTQFIAEYFPLYTCIFQMILPRFMRLDLSAPKNAVMLFRLGKVFSQPLLVNILRELELAVCVNNNEIYGGSEFNSPYINQSYTDINTSLNRWGAVAKQAVSELNLSPNYCYEPVWSEEGKSFLLEFLKRIMSGITISENIVEEYHKKIMQHNKGFWAFFNFWSLMGIMDEDEMSLEEYRKVPAYLKSAFHYFSSIFGLNDNSLMHQETILEDTSAEQSSFMNTSNFSYAITNKLRNKSTNIHYMGDPDLMPIMSHESTILVRILYQIATRINEMYKDEFSRLWAANNFWGIVAREMLQKPCSIQTYYRDSFNRNNIVTQHLPARVSFRKLGSHAFVVWMTLGYIFFRFLGFSGISFLFIIIILWLSFVLLKSTAKFVGLVKS